MIGPAAHDDTDAPLSARIGALLDRQHELLVRLDDLGRRQMGLIAEKRIAFYNTTYSSCDLEIDTLKTATIGELAGLKEEEYGRFFREGDNEMGGVLLTT